MKCKKLIASLVLCATMLTMALPVGAVTSSFSDVRDPATAVNADILRLMGVVSGSGGNNFDPNEHLTRGQFCVMAVKVMGRGDEVPLYTTRTIFSDVTARHWARGYINLAASITVGSSEEGQAGGRLISGVGTGQFRPDAPITFAQAVTILMRMMGYSDDQAGSVWPAGYMNLAGSLGLTQGINTGYNSPITRAQAAQLFVNLLTTKTQRGGEYGETLGSAKKDVLLLAVNVDGDDGRPGAIRTSEGTYHPATEHVTPTALLGRRGTLLLNERSQILTFVPDQSESVTITLSGDAQAAYVKGTDGKRYAISPATPAFTSSTEKPSTTWGDLWVDLHSGAQVTLFLEGGKVIGVYYAAGGVNASQAYVVTGPLSSASFHQITGGVTNYTIKKDNETITLADVKPYDVATYDAVSNTVIVSDLRLNCVYERATPNAQTPTTITVMGHDFPVLDTALDSISQFKLGNTVVLLLTADGQVAGMAKPTLQTRSTATGLAGNDSVVIDLPNGQTITLSGKVEERVHDQVVSVSAAANGYINATRVLSQSIPGTFDLENMTLGDYKVAAGVRVYERVGNSGAIPTTLSALDVKTLPANKIDAYRLNTSGMVDLIVLDAVTGDAYTYGILHKGEISFSDGTLHGSNPTVSVENGSGGLPAIITGTPFQEGDFGGTVAGLRQIDGTPVAVDLLVLEGLKGVQRSDFFQKDGLWYVNAKGTVYQVADDVEGYKQVIGEWFADEDDRLATIRAYSNDMTVYVDPISHKVRIISCK